MRPITIFLFAVLTASGAAAQSTAYPPDLPDAVPAPPRRLVVKAEPLLDGDVVIARKGAAVKRGKSPVIGVNLRLVDVETGEMLATVLVRGESPAIGEATAAAVTRLVEWMVGSVPAPLARPRQIEGRVADVRPDGAVLAVGTEAGVLRGDRFEIFKITGEIKDPVTKTVLDVDMVKVGEFVADQVHGKIAYGCYGGEALWSAYATVGRGYLARLVTK